jgi:hypothetical protein
MNACESSKIYTFIIILLHAKCIILRAPHFSPGLGTGVGGVQVFCFAYCTYIYRISSFHQHRHRAKKKICVFTVTRPTLTFFISNYSTLIFANDPINFYTEFGYSIFVV